MTSAVSTPLVAVELVAACVWVGSMVCLAVVTDAARRVLEATDQVKLFRLVGRRYALLGTTSLLVGIGAGLWLVWPPRGWSTTIDASVALSGFLVIATAAGMAQARSMTRLRRRSNSDASDSAAARAVQQGRRLATALRGVMAAATAAIIVLAAEAIAH